MRRSALFALCLAGCSYTFGGVGEDVRLIGEPPRLPSDIPRARQSTSQARHLMFGSDGKPWVVLRDRDLVGMTDAEEVQLAPPFDVQTQTGTFLLFGRNTYYGLDERSNGTSSLVLYTAGTRSTGRITLTGGTGQLVLSAGEQALLWVPDNKAAKLLLGRIGSGTREIGREEYHTGPPGPIFDGKGDWFFFYGPDGQVSARATAEDKVVKLGPWEGLVLRNTAGGLAVCTPAGVEVRMLDGVTRIPATDEACRSDAPFMADDEFAYYVSDTRVRSIHLGGGAVPQDLGEFVAGRVFGAFSGGRVVMVEPGNTVTPIWLGDRRIADRARQIAFSSDGRRLRYLEHAATTNQIGSELYSLPLDGGEPELIGRNVKRYAELPDGRVIAAVNQAFVGPQNRVVVIDERERTAHYVAASAKDFELFPGAEEVLVGLSPALVGNATDWVVLPVPRRTRP